MGSRDIVRKAWQITQVHLKKLIWYGALPSFFTIVVSSAYILYQYDAFRHSELLGGPAGGDVISRLQILWAWVSSHPGITVTFAVFAFLFLLGYFLLPAIFRGTLIAAIDRIQDFKPISGSVEIGLRHFFPMFEFGLLTGSFSVVTLFTESSFILRWWGVNVFFVALPVLIFIAMIGLILSFLFTYAEYFIVLKNQGLITSIKESVILVIANLRKTILVFILMLLIGVRIVLNVILVLLIPMMIVGLGSYFATFVSSLFGIIIIGLVSLIVLLVASYLFGLFHVFATAVWVLTFRLLLEKGGETLTDATPEA